MIRTKDWKEKLVEVVKATAQEIINRADDIVGDDDMLAGITIQLRFQSGEAPELEVTRQCFVRESLKVYK